MGVSPDKDGRRGDHQQSGDTPPDVQPTVPEVGFEVKRVSHLQEVLLAADGELDFPGETVLKDLALMADVAAAFTPRRDVQNEQGKLRIGEPFAQ